MWQRFAQSIDRFWRYAFLVAILSICPAAQDRTAKAQEMPRSEFFVGPSYAAYGAGIGMNGFGWNSSVSLNLNRWFGVLGEAGGHYGGTGGTAHVHTLMAGPRFSWRASEKSTVFGHMLAGYVRRWAGFPSLNSHIYGLGGGWDYRVGNPVAVRILQVDYFKLGFFPASNKDNYSLRFATGIVFRFGEID